MMVAKSGILTFVGAAALLVSVAVGGRSAMAHSPGPSTAFPWPASPTDQIAAMHCIDGSGNCAPGTKPVSCGNLTHPCRIVEGRQAVDPTLHPGSVK